MNGQLGRLHSQGCLRQARRDRLVAGRSCLLAQRPGCDELTAGDTGAAGTAAKLADSAQPFFGLRDGTYTTTEVRDRNGVIDDPLVPLNTPLEMHMELHAWSETSGDCGNVTVAGHASGRVLDLSVDGAEVRLSIVNAQEGLEDLLSTMTMTPQDDTARPSYSRALENRWAALAGTARHLV